MQQQLPTQGSGTGRNYTNIICKEKSVEANVELRQGLHKIVRKLPAFGNLAFYISIFIMLLIGNHIVYGRGAPCRGFL